MFGVSKEYVDQTVSGLGEVIDTRILEAGVGLKAADKYAHERILEIQKKLEDLEFCRESLERECADRARQEQESIEWNRKNMRLECLRMSSSGGRVAEGAMAAYDREVLGMSRREWRKKWHKSKLTR